MEGPISRKVALCIISAIIFSLQIYVVSCKPKWVHLVESCPMANNLTDWIRASDELRCIHSLTSKNSAEQSHVYHCLPSSFLNETVEFCGKSVPVEEGNCPVYTYAFGDNYSPNARICTNFSKGCPKKLYFSKLCYLYSECLNVNKRCRCYRADPTCTEDCLEPDTELANRSTNDIAEHTRVRPVSESGTNDITQEPTIELPNRSTKDIAEHTTVHPVSESGTHDITREPTIELANRSTKDIAVHTTVHPVSESETNDIIIVLSVGFTLCVLGLAILMIVCKVYRRVKMSKRYDGTERVCLSTTDETVRLNEDDSIKHFPLQELLCSIGKRLKKGSIEKFSFHLNAQKKSTKHQRINGLSNGSDILLRMHEIYDFSLNLFLLQAFLEKAKEEALSRRCIEFAKKNDKIYYTKGNVCEKGYRELILNLNKKIDEFHDGEIDKMRKDLSSVMQMEGPEDILLKAISKGSVLVHFLIKKKYLTIARDCNFSFLKRYGLQEITLMGKRIYPEDNREEPLEQSNSTLPEQEKLETKIYLSEVSFEFGPKELTAHKRVAEEIQFIWKLTGKEKSPVDSVHIIHCTEKDREEICLELFESTPNVINVDELKTLDKLLHSKRIIICCIGNHPQNEAYLHLLQDLNVSENLFVYTTEKDVGRMEQRVLDIIGIFGEKVKKDHILHSNADKHELYRLYCNYVEKELAELFKTIKCKIDKENTNFINVLAMNLRKLVFLKRILKFDNDTGKRLSNECMELLRRIKDDVVGYIVDRDTLVLLKKEPGRWSKGFSQNVEKIHEQLRGMKVKVNIITMQALVSGSEIYCCNRRFMGSLGMFANINENGKMEQVCISSGHMVQKDEIVYFDNDGINVELGYGIWPEKGKSDLDFLTSVSVIKLYEDAKSMIRRRFNEPIKLYRGSVNELEHRKVFKYGASSNLTYGYLQGEIQTNLFGESHMPMVFVEPQSDSFSSPGDSGAVVLTKIMKEYFALGIVVGGSLQTYGEESEYEKYSENSTIVAMLSESIDKFQSHHKEIDIVDYFM